ncbi:unnamed protein product [Agarophyton chilense]
MQPTVIPRDAARVFIAPLVIGDLSEPPGIEIHVKKKPMVFFHRGRQNSMTQYPRVSSDGMDITVPEALIRHLVSRKAPHLVVRSHGAAAERFVRREINRGTDGNGKVRRESGLSDGLIWRVRHSARPME